MFRAKHFCETKMFVARFYGLIGLLEQINQSYFCQFCQYHIASGKSNNPAI
jgi:hypothetical protein